VPSEMQIARADASLCDLEPLADRVDATKTFTRHETIFVELETIDGVVGTGFSYTIGTGGPPGGARMMIEAVRAGAAARHEGAR
jgi:L-alanine-DL-glutamate epimerase-like enolase superfamily enzyme